jgi:hypothetical protein
MKYAGGIDSEAARLFLRGGAAEPGSLPVAPSTLKAPIELVVRSAA